MFECVNAGGVRGLACSRLMSVVCVPWGLFVLLLCLCQCWCGVGAQAVCVPGTSRAWGSGGVVRALRSRECVDRATWVGWSAGFCLCCFVLLHCCSVCCKDLHCSLAVPGTRGLRAPGLGWGRGARLAISVRDPQGQAAGRTQGQYAHCSVVLLGRGDGVQLSLPGVPGSGRVAQRRTRSKLRLQSVRKFLARGAVAFAGYRV